ncbi:hypothetical protein EOM27_03470 [Candidatus Saccharibacteria bacterium]|nr:hypothetical protein [Candidatus Saccharibacteria bacterium]NCU44014.1 hypothetical protein [Candidatus Saccharibacteria bacterium]
MSSPLSSYQDPEDSIELLNTPENQPQPLDMDNLTEQQLYQIESWSFSDEELAAIGESQQAIQEAKDVLDIDEAHEAYSLKDVEEKTAEESRVSWTTSTLDMLPLSGVPYFSRIQADAREKIARADKIKDINENIKQTRERVEDIFKGHSQSSLDQDANNELYEEEHNYFSISIGDSDEEKIYIKQRKPELADDLHARAEIKLPKETFYLPDGSPISLNQKIIQGANGDYEKVLVYDISSNPELADHYNISGEIQHIDIDLADADLLSKINQMDFSEDITKNSQKDEFKEQVSIDSGKDSLEN